MKIKPINSQISIFLSDGLMNPSKLIENIAEAFDNTFNKKIFNLDLADAPSEMPLLRYSSSDDKYIYESSKKRINFYINFDNENFNHFEAFKNKIFKFIKNVVLNYSDISRVGIAVTYYIDKKDDKYSFWAKKFKFPFYTDKTSEINYSINNNFFINGLKYNKILTLTTGKISSLKNVPIIAIDVNNVSTAKLSEESLKYIFNEIDSYTENEISKLLGKDETE